LALVKVGDIFSKTFSSIREDEKLSKAIEIFEKERLPALVVLDSKGIYRGILAQRWITRSGQDPSATKVQSLSRSAPRLTPEDSIGKAARLMIESEIRQLPVFAKDKLLGFVTDEQIIHAVVMDQWGDRKVSETMTRKPYFVEENEPVGEVLNLFRQHDISHSPVLNKGKVVGMVSVIDVVEHLFKPLERPRRSGFTVDKTKTLAGPVKDIMSEPAVTVSPDTTLKDAEQLMHKNDVHSLVVVEDDFPIGIITKRDFLEPLAQMEIKEEALSVQFSAKGVELDESQKQYIMDDFKSFAQRYGKFLEAGTVFVYMKTYGASHKGEQLINCRLQLRTKAGNFFSSSDGWNLEETFRIALEHLERQLVKSKEFEQTKDFRENYLRRIGWPMAEL
jgi:predicted transcriptional regulator/ribosome-associated translation inhibitor RaiA